MAGDPTIGAPSGSYLVDPDTRTFAKRIKQLGDGHKPQTVQDIRKALA